MWDSKENFYSKETQRNLGDNFVFKSKIQFQTKEEFLKEWEQVEDDEILVFCCHYKCADGSFYQNFQYSRIKEEYNIPDVHYLSNNALKASKNYQESRRESERIIHYNTFMEKITKGEIPTFTKNSIKHYEDLLERESLKDTKSEYPRIKYAIITALYDDEFEQVKKVFNFPEDEELIVGDKTYYIGYLISNPKIQVVAGVPYNTGMVDASIIATHMLEIFKPDYILMTGVCGGFKGDCNLGDIVVARNVYTFQKGKLSDIKTKDAKGNLAKIDLYDKDNNVIQYDKLYDKEGNQISISIENFKREDDSVITIDHFKDKYDKHKKEIIEIINKKTLVSIKKC